MDILESREAALRAKVLGASAASPPLSALSERLRALQTQLEQLSGAVSGSSALQALCTHLPNQRIEIVILQNTDYLPFGSPDRENASHLTLQSAGAFALGSARAGDEMKRAAILSSAERVEQATAQFRRLQELQVVLEQLKAPGAEQQLQVRRLEDDAEHQTERALAVHARVERVLAAYQQLVLVLSEKCVEYNALLDQLQV
ncbi:hypothetical protein BBJ28_00024414 [Nothophytophthora sp. Chile5]|nr:hypothetical protein BBJ28_00024414 [Nothophytophthora sp. Chile5]